MNEKKGRERRSAHRGQSEVDTGEECPLLLKFKAKAMPMLEILVFPAVKRQAPFW
jgi:hypothetical protein